MSSFTLLKKHERVTTDDLSESRDYSTIIIISSFPSYPKSKKAACLGFLDSNIIFAFKS